MVKATIQIPENENRILDIIKGKYGLKTKEQAIAMAIKLYGQELLEPELRPEFVEEMKKVEKQKKTSFKNTKELRKIIEE